MSFMSIMQLYYLKNYFVFTWLKWKKKSFLDHVNSKPRETLLRLDKFKGGFSHAGQFSWLSPLGLYWLVTRFKDIEFKIDYFAISVISPGPRF